MRRLSVTAVSSTFKSAVFAARLGGRRQEAGGGSGSIAAGNSRLYTLRYLATAAGTHEAQLEIPFTYDGVQYAGFVVQFEGSAEYLPHAQLWVDDQLVAEEAQAAATAAVEPLTLTLSLTPTLDTTTSIRWIRLPQTQPSSNHNINPNPTPTPTRPQPKNLTAQITKMAAAAPGEMIWVDMELKLMV